LFPPIFATLVSAYGWRVANVIICGFGLLVGILVLCFLRVGPLPTRRPAHVTAGATDPLPGMSFEDARCTPTFYCLYLCMRAARQPSTVSTCACYWGSRGRAPW
jgi:hypothetical protein